MIPSSHQGSWRGPNRLWLDSPVNAERSDGSLVVDAWSVKVQWSFRGAPQVGELVFSGPAPALACRFTDSFHAAEGMVLHGTLAEGQVVLCGTYSAGAGPDWGWRMTLDFVDPEHVTLRMFNVEPKGDVTLAMDLHASRGTAGA